MKLRNNVLFILGVSLLFAGCTTDLLENEEHELAEDGIEQAMEQEFLMTHDPATNTIPRQRLETARTYSEILPTGQSGIQSLSWQERGPNAIGGRTRAIVVDRRDNTGNTVLAASVSGGIFRTTNFTSAAPNWSPVADNMLNLAVTCMIQDRSNGAIMYAGTGEGWTNIDAVMGAGIFKSTDGGLTWTQMPSTAAFEYIQDIMQDNNGFLYASLRNSNTLNRGVVRSTDNGASWTQVLGLGVGNFVTGRAADLEVASNGDIYATLGIFSKTVVLKSAGSNGANTGALNTWVDITPYHTNTTARAEVAVAPSDPQRVYLALEDSATHKVLAFFRSSNGGAAWDSLAAPDAAFNGGSPQTWYNLIVQVAPTNPDMVYVGGLQVGRSMDAGTSWLTVATTSQVHADQHQMIFIDNSRLIIGNDGGLYYSVNADATTPTFTNRNTNYNVTQFYAADLHPTDANYFIGGAQDNNTLKFTSAGINPGIPVVGGDGGFCHIKQNDGNFQIAAYVNNNYYRSVNGGANWAALTGGVNNSRGRFINPTDLDDANNVLYCSDDASKYYYITGLDASPVGNQVTLSELGSNRLVTAVRVDPFTSNTVWLGTASTGVAVMPEIVKVTNANTATPTATAFLLPSVNGASVSSIDIDPNNAQHMLVTLSNYGITNVFETNNGGSTWSGIDGNLPDMPVRWGLIVPSNATVPGSSAGGGLLIATELGVWFVQAGNGTSTTWVQQNSGFPNVRTDMLRYRPSDGTVLAATHGRGLFTSSLTLTTTAVNPVTLTRGFIKYISAADNQLLIATGNLGVQKIQTEILDMSGRLVYRSGGSYQNTTIYTGNLSKGVYVLRVFGDKGEYYAQQFMK